MGCALREGLLWYDASPGLSPEARLAEAAARFAERFGRPPNCCHVHPDEVFDDPVITVVADPAVMRRHYWVGYDAALDVGRARGGQQARKRTA